MSDPNRALEAKAKQQAKQVRHNEKIAGLTFREWPKIARLNREIVITEKIDGTNAAIGIIPEMISVAGPGGGSEDVPTGKFRVYAQSRTRIITAEDDNYGFAAWVERNAAVLAFTLGPGLHFGEWWGVSIGRSYGLSERRFSLFNTHKWGSGEGAVALHNARARGLAIYCVPILYEGLWQEDAISFAPRDCVDILKLSGSKAVPGFMDSEGVVVYHKASGICYKVTCENDEQPKGKVNA